MSLLPKNPSTANSPAMGTSQIHEQLIFNLALQVTTEIAPGEFQQQLLDVAIQGLHASGGSLWSLVPESDNWDCRCQAGTEIENFQPLTTPGVMALRSEVANTGKPQQIQIDDQDYAVLLFAPLTMREDHSIFLELYLSDTPHAELDDDSQVFLEMLAELHGEYLKQQQLKHFQEQQSSRNELDEFSRKLQSLWNPPDIYYTIADGSRILSSFDRVTLVTGLAGRFRVKAISCANEPSSQSESIRKLESLGRVLASSSQALIYEGGSTEGLAPEIQAAVEQVIKTTDARLIHAYPLVAPAKIRGVESPLTIGVLLGEHFRGDLDPSAPQKLRMLTEVVSPAIERAAYWENLPVNGLFRGWITLVGSPFLRTRLLHRWMLLALMLIAASLVWIPVDFQVYMEGQLLPKERRHLFAPTDAIVDQIHFEPGEPVSLNNNLLTLRDLDLELKLEEVRGEQESVATRLQTIQTLRSSLIRGSGDPAKDDELSAEANELLKRQKSLDAQLELLEQQDKQLHLQAPMSGVLLTWNPHELLASRPVVAGQLLLTVADLESDWEIDLQIPEKEWGHISSALEANSGTLSLEYRMYSHLSQFHSASLSREKISRRAEIDADLEHFFRAEVPLTAPLSFAPIPGAEVEVSIGCGQRSLGFVLFHDLYEWIQRNILY